MAAADESLARDVGVHHGLVAAIRRDNLTENEHWTRDAVTGRVDYTDAGRALVLELLQVPKKIEGAAPGVSGEAGPVEALPEPQRLKVCRMLPNPLWVGVALPGGALVHVQVRRRTGLRVGALLLCQLQPCGRWECVQPGHASPLPKKEGGAAS